MEEMVNVKVSDYIEAYKNRMKKLKEDYDFFIQQEKDFGFFDFKAKRDFKKSIDENINEKAEIYAYFNVLLYCPEETILISLEKLRFIIQYQQIEHPERTIYKKGEK